MEALALLAYLTVFPCAALIIAGVFAYVYMRRKTISAVVASILWALYAGYEYLMYTRVLCTGECNIRIDLLLLYPVLLFVSLLAVICAIRRGSAGRSER